MTLNVVYGTPEKGVQKLLHSLQSVSKVTFEWISARGFLKNTKNESDFFLFLSKNSVLLNFSDQL